MQGKHRYRWLLTAASLGWTLTLLFAPAAWAAGRDPDSHGDKASATHASQTVVMADPDEAATTSSTIADTDDTTTTTTTTTSCATDPDAHGDAVSALARTDIESATDADAHGDAVSAVAQTQTCATSSDMDDTGNT